MDLNKMIEKYAYTLARVGLNVQKDQVVLVEAAIEGYEFTSIFAKECYKLGAKNVVISYLDQKNLIVAGEYRDEEEFKEADPLEKLIYEKYLEEGACYVRLEGVNPKIMENVSEKTSNAIFAHVDNTRNVMRKASRTKGCQWLIAMVPTKEWASLLFKDKDEKEALEELWKLLFKLCYIDEDNDIVKTWEELGERKQEKAKLLDSLNIRKLHYTSSNGTDLYLELNPYSKYAHVMGDKIHFNPNIPTEEIACSPEKYGTNGVVYATRPLVLGGKSIENFGFRFKDGKVVEVLADEGKEMLEALIHTDENAGYLGEAALVEYHSPISMSGLVYYTTLIDENASCHLALGRALGDKSPDPKYTFNDSQIHIDFMVGAPDTRIVATTESGEEIVIFNNGDFAI
ncbi:MAG: aminopeptidase [Erysipelotrichaceae bacterium]|nr:aminopeptidase [Erysipelotrichaceae bacterium]